MTDFELDYAKHMIEKHVDEIDELKFDDLYKDCVLMYRSAVTQVLWEAELHPEEYLIYLPARFLAYCTNITEFHVPEQCLAISTNAFYRCTELHEVHIPRYVRLGNDCFSMCQKLKTIYFGGTKDEWGMMCTNPYAYFKYVYDVEVLCTDGRLVIT